MDPRFQQEKGTGLYTGNELIVKGALESGVGEITGYPGSPLAEVFETLENIAPLLVEHGIVAQIANNEALAAARLNGSQMEEIRALAVMKSVGLHVAADGLALGNMAGARAGALVAVGDDTWSEGTQVPADSRFLSQHLYMPVLEPATFQEIKDWVGEGFALSAASQLYLTFLVTSNQADGGGSVEVRPNHYPTLNTRRRTTLDTRTISSDARVIIPPITARKEQEVLHERFPRLLELARQRGLSQLLYQKAQSTLGFITSGLAYAYLEHALHLLGLTGAFPILKLGVTYPVDPALVALFAGQVKHLCVVEEKRAFVEPQVAAILTQQRQAGHCLETELWGKRFPGEQAGFPETMGLHPSLVVQHLGRLFAALDGLPVDPQRLQRELRQAQAAELALEPVPARTPSFCPGCPHRDSASVLQRTAEDFADPSYMEKQGRPTADLVFHGDIGCYSMLKYAPFSRLMHNLSGMGLGGGTGAGIDPFIDNKQVVFMGDSTFFHSGMAAVSDSIKNHQDITYVILDNKTTAMTGHQPTPGTEADLLGNPTFAQDIERVVRGLAQGSDTFIARMDPAARGEYRRLVEEAVLRPGVKIIIADKECGITFHRRERSRRSALIKERGYLPAETHINISEEVCEYCLECTRGTGCSGLTLKATDYGPKIAIDLSSCVADGACTRVEVQGGDKTCPSFEEIEIHRLGPPVINLPQVELAELPQPAFKPLHEVWYTYIAGVGGMGINVVASVLAQAGARQGYAVRLTNKKGLAIRNGSVYSHLSFAPDQRILSSITPYGGAQLLLGLDLLEAARGLDPRERHKIASPGRTRAIVNTARTPTINTLIGADAFATEEIAARIAAHTGPGMYCGVDLFGICEQYLGNKLYANIMMLGLAYQLGALPLELENLTAAIKVAVRRDLDTNMRAFAMGRKLALDPDCFSLPETPPTCAGLIEEKSALLRQTRGEEAARRYRLQTAACLEGLNLDEESRRHLALRLYDLTQYEDHAYASRYAALVRKVHGRDSDRHGYAATRAVIRCLAKVMAIKDEVYVAHLLTSPEKYQRDARRYHLDLKRGDHIEYRHLTRPHFRLFGRDFRPDIKTRDWQLRLLGRMRFLRRLFSSWWHVEEVEFREWYCGLAKGFAYESEAEYRTWVQVLELPEEVRGYRAVREPKMAAARRRAAELLEQRPPSRAPGTLDIEPVALSSSAAS
ncbi:MAG: 2-oxoacid:acceptor oxidoreductase family protein [Candidatus Handelsmanbacteria bacterium]|nr:2-oxoacid:acceptor oxidoreductase family protein [Candidatus Handelsmanbacteria bacterium]